MSDFLDRLASRLSHPSVLHARPAVRFSSAEAPDLLDERAASAPSRAEAERRRVPQAHAGVPPDAGPVTPVRPQSTAAPQQLTRQDMSVEAMSEPAPTLAPAAEPARPLQPQVARPYVLAAPPDRPPVWLAPEPAAMVVRVTIGRVEVRMAPQAPAPATPAPRQSRGSSMTLDDYLRQRDGDRP